MVGMWVLTLLIYLAFLPSTVVGNRRHRFRFRRDDITLSGGTGFNVPFLNNVANNSQSSILKNLFSSTNVGQQTGAAINVGNNQPRGSFGQETNILGLFNQQKGIGGGVDPQGRIGGEWGDNFGIFNNLFGFGKQGQAKVDLQNSNAAFNENFGLGPLFQSNRGFNIDWSNLSNTLKNG